MVKIDKLVENITGRLTKIMWVIRKKNPYTNSHKTKNLWSELKCVCDHIRVCLCVSIRSKIYSFRYKKGRITHLITPNNLWNFKIYKQ